MPLFASAVIASVVAERMTATRYARELVGSDDATGVKTFVAAWFVVRAAYSVAYVQIADPSKSAVRSAIWAFGTALATYQIYRAAVVWG